MDDHTTSDLGARADTLSFAPARTQGLSRTARLALLGALSSMVLAACGGGGGDSSSDGSASPPPPAPAPAPTPAPSPAPTPAPAPAPTPAPSPSPSPSPAPSPTPAPPPPPAGPSLVQPPIDLDTSNGVIGLLPSSHGFPSSEVSYPETNDTATGGQGQPVDGYTCGVMDETFHVHAHVSIFLNGVQLAIPASLGGVAQSDGTTCHYSLHTHDSTGKIHVEAPTPINATLGQFFDIWGEPLSSTDVLGVTGQAIVTYYTDDGVTLNQWAGNPADLPLVSHRQITIEIGTPLTQIPTYSWSGT